MAREPMSIAVRINKPAIFPGTDVQWRVLADLYPAAETPEIIMAVLDYCTVRKLDPMKKPVHIVAMYNSKLRRKVQVVMSGINEVEITASRSGKWTGMDMPVWGPDVERTFRGQFENDDGSTRNVEMTLTYPTWCAVTVYRDVGGVQRAFTEQLFWDECYGRASFRSEVPNQRWQQAPRQMIHKCTKAAVLRAAFPEDVSDYTDDEMDGREVDAGGITIDGTPERPAEPQRPAPKREITQRQVDAMENASTDADGGDWRIATPDGGFAFRNSIDWLAQWDKLIAQYKDQPNELRALRHMNNGTFTEAGQMDMGAVMDVETRLDAILDRPRGGAR
jgi:phage recombination protein Bet